MVACESAFGWLSLVSLGHDPQKCCLLTNWILISAKILVSSWRFAIVGRGGILRRNAR